MNPLLHLLLRIVRGERYQKTTQADVVHWFAFLASLPFPIFSFVKVLSLYPNLHVFWVWLLLVAMGLVTGIAWLLLRKIGSVTILSIMIVAEYSSAWFYVQSLI